MAIDNSSQPSYVQALTGGTSGPYSWASSAGMSISVTYSFDISNMLDSTGADTLDGAQQDAVEEALALWASVANITYLENDSSPDIVFAVKSLTTGKLGDTSLGHIGSLLVHTDVVFDENQVSGYTAGEEAFETILHEIGHAFGLSHPGGYSDSYGYTRRI